MSQHFLLSSKAKTLRLADVLRMTDGETHTAFCKVRWHETDGAPVCPHCGGLDAYLNPRPTGSARYRCKACAKDFTVTSGTLFASHKRPLRDGLAYKSAFVLLHKLREAMAEELKGRVVGGEGKTAEIDGGHFGGYVKPANHAESRKDRRRVVNQNGKRQAVVIIRERDGKSLPAVFRTEGAALSWIKSRIKPGTLVNADEAGAWNDLQSRFEMKRINHEKAYSADGACTNMAEEFFSRMRRAEIGHHHHIAGNYLLRYAQEASWREDNRRVPNGDQTQRVAHLAMNRKPSVDFSGYWQRHKSTASAS